MEHDPSFSSLVTVEIETKGGDFYSFPAVDREQLLKVLPAGEPTLSHPTLAVINASFAVLSIPFRIIKTVKAGGDVVWST